eukprot:5280600-Pleurochrysis_carterae.AAC.1
MRWHQEPRWILGIATDRSISTRSEPRHRPRHRGAASPRLRYADGYSHDGTRGRATNSNRRRTAARDTAPSAGRPQS